MTTTIELKDFRQPLVTSLGVMLGFLIGFLGQWVTEDNFALNSATDNMTFFGCLIGAVCLLIALFRMLSPTVSPNASLQHYQRTLAIYMLGVCLSLGSLFVAALL